MTNIIYLITKSTLLELKKNVIMYVFYVGCSNTSLIIPTLQTLNFEVMI